MLSSKQLAELRAEPLIGPNRLFRAMDLAGVTQIDVAAATTFTQSYVSRIGNGQYQRLPGETMRTLAAYFGCTIEDLFPARQHQEQSA